MGMKLMLGVKSGGLSQEKAIEEFRDDFNTSQASSQQVIYTCQSYPWSSKQINALFVKAEESSTETKTKQTR